MFLLKTTFNYPLISSTVQRQSVSSEGFQSVQIIFWQVATYNHEEKKGENASTKTADEKIEALRHSISSTL